MDAFELSPVELQEVNKRITTFYDGQKRKFTKSVNRSEQDVLAEKSLASKKARLDKVSDIT